ncbi:unnamed protein product [Nesidiocoris tenuis]|uniref:Mitochondrial thiamine pyrophosphate carrier n=1 Tax=Nesidiocoris tenuis TaxID=355587 RepID=A0A6H5GFP7_9HEMI|nr:unnamed protein product [Nesidiocoris tenuis]
MVGFDSKAKEQLSHGWIMLSAAVAGALSRFISQPLDVLKIRFQLQVEPITNKSAVSKYKTLRQAFLVVWREEGLRGLWGGHNPGQLLSIIYATTNFTVFELLTRFSHEQLGLNRSGAVNFVCGAGSGCAAVFCSYPFDVLRTRFIAQGAANVTYRSMINGLTSMVRKEGISAPFKGLSPALLQGGPLIGVSFATHSFVKTIFERYETLSKSADRLNLSGNVIAGGVAGFVSKASIYPLDLARRRLQFQGFQDSRIGYGQNFTCRNLVHCMQLTVAKEGVKGLFKGFVPSAVKTTLSTSLYFTIYEELCDFFSYVHTLDKVS